MRFTRRWCDEVFVNGCEELNAETQNPGNELNEVGWQRIHVGDNSLSSS